MCSGRGFLCGLVGIALYYKDVLATGRIYGLTFDMYM